MDFMEDAVNHVHSREEQLSSSQLQGPSVVLTMASSSESGNESTVDESNVPVLDPMIWGNMPASLVEMVFKMVPFASLMHFRTLSKYWNTLIMSPKFARDCQRQVTAKSVPIALCTRQNRRRRVRPASLKIFNSKTNTWVSLPVPLPTGAVDLSFTLTACSGGLMCFSSTDRRQFVVCNPLTGAFRRLDVPYPASEDVEVLGHHIFRRRYVFTGLLVDQDAGSFKLVVVYLAEAPDKSTLLYDSTEKSWRSGAPVPRHDWVRSHPFEGVVDTLTSKQSVYGLVKRSNIWTVRNVGGGCTLLKYDVRNNRWLEANLHIGETGSRKNTLKLLEYQSHILLVTRTVFPREYTIPFRVEEATDGHQMTLVEERFAFEDIQRSFNDVRRDTAAICWAGDVRYSIPGGGSESEDDYIMVVRFNSRTKELFVLPRLSMSDNLEVFSEIRILEPSVTIDV